MFEEVRRRGLTSAGDPLREGQYFFEESCAQAMFNATNTNAPFKSCAPFLVAPAAIALA